MVQQKKETVIETYGKKQQRANFGRVAVEDHGGPIIITILILNVLFTLDLNYDRC
jgi:hypothetical protein